MIDDGVHIGIKTYLLQKMDKKLDDGTENAIMAMCAFVSMRRA